MKTLVEFLMEQEKDFCRKRRIYEDDEQAAEIETSAEPEAEEDAAGENVVDINGFVVIKPGFLDKEAEIRSRLEDLGWAVVGEATKKLTEDEAKDFYAEKENEPYFDELIEYMTSDESKCLMLWKEEAAKPIEEIRNLKEKLRAELAEDEMKNVMHSPDSFDEMERELEIFLAEQPEEEDEDEEDGEDEENDDSEDSEDSEDNEDDEDVEDTDVEDTDVEDTDTDEDEDGGESF